MGTDVVPQTQRVKSQCIWWKMSLKLANSVVIHYHHKTTDNI